MRVPCIASVLTLACTLACTIQALSLPESATALSIRDDSTAASTLLRRVSELHNSLERRKGGGGGRGGGGGGGSSSGGGGRGSSGGSGSAVNARPTSNQGGKTSTGTGVTPRFGGGSYYGGGASVPYRAGTPTRNILPFFLPAVALLAIFPLAAYAYGAHAYNFHNPYTFLNESYINGTLQRFNQTLPVTCLCSYYEVCACEENSNPQYIHDLVGNGSYNALNKSVVNVATINGETKLYIDGTLANGTTASGGLDISAGVQLRALRFSSWWILGVLAVYSVCLL